MALGVDAKNAVMVGDGALDMQAGRELNMQCLGVLTGSNDAQALLPRVQIKCLRIIAALQAC